MHTIGWLPCLQQISGPSQPGRGEKLLLLVGHVHRQHLQSPDQEVGQGEPLQNSGHPDGPQVVVVVRSVEEEPYQEEQQASPAHVHEGQHPVAGSSDLVPAGARQKILVRF